MIIRKMNINIINNKLIFKTMIIIIIIKIIIITYNKMTMIIIREMIQNTKNYKYKSPIITNKKFKSK